MTHLSYNFYQEIDQLWPSTTKPSHIQALYEAGLAGCHLYPAGVERLLRHGEVDLFVQHCEHLRGLSKERPLVMLWRSREKYDPGAFGEEAQRTGDCVGQCSRNARDITRCIEIHINGEPEEYYKRGAIEPTYGARGHSGRGMAVSDAAKFEVNVGFLFRQAYPELGFDLTKYNPELEISWGRSGVPAAVQAVCRQHNVGRWIKPSTTEEALDLLAAGYSCLSGQYVGFLNTPDKYGIHRRGKNWSHAMATAGYDLTKKVWPVPVVFVVNSWGAWNFQWDKWPRELLGPPIVGMLTITLDDWSKYFVGTKEMLFYADIKGVPAKLLPDWGGSYLG